LMNVARYEGLATCGKAAGEGCIVGTLDVESQERWTKKTARIRASN
jgi:hypothetical protein